jgi:hypothetical protein
VGVEGHHAVGLAHGRAQRVDGAVGGGAGGVVGAIGSQAAHRGRGEVHREQRSPAVLVGAEQHGGRVPGEHRLAGEAVEVRQQVAPLAAGEVHQRQGVIAGPRRGRAARAHAHHPPPVGRHLGGAVVGVVLGQQGVGAHRRAVALVGQQVHGTRGDVGVFTGARRHGGASVGGQRERRQVQCRPGERVEVVPCVAVGVGVGVGGEQPALARRQPPVPVAGREVGQQRRGDVAVVASLLDGGVGAPVARLRVDPGQDRHPAGLLGDGVGLHPTGRARHRLSLAAWWQAPQPRSGFGVVGVGTFARGGEQQ